MYITFSIQDKGDGDKLFYTIHLEKDDAGFGVQESPHHTLPLNIIIEEFKGAIAHWERLENSEKTEGELNDKQRRKAYRKIYQG